MKSVSTFVSHSVRKTNTMMRAVATALLVVVVVIVLPDTGVSVVDGVLGQTVFGRSCEAQRKNKKVLYFAKFCDITKCPFVRL